MIASALRGSRGQPRAEAAAVGSGDAEPEAQPGQDGVAPSCSGTASALLTHIVIRP